MVSQWALADNGMMITMAVAAKNATADFFILNFIAFAFIFTPPDALNFLL